MSGLLFSKTTKADTILFPYIVKSDTVTTLISVVNKTLSASYLKYIYRHKDANQPVANCDVTSFKRPTSENDLISFDVAGRFNEGNALFNDTNSYMYGDTFHLKDTGVKRGYLLVTHSNNLGERVSVGSEGLYGEAVIIDVVTGGAWGYRAINDREREDYTFTDTGTGSALYTIEEACIPNPIYGEPPYCYPSTPGESRTFIFFPPNEWVTRFFVTPIGNGMDTENLTGRVNVVSKIISPAAPLGGVYGRGGGYAMGDTFAKDLTCVAAFDLVDFMDSTARAAVENIGGWAYFYNLGLTNPVVIYKLEYVLNNSAYGGTINNGYCLSCSP